MTSAATEIPALLPSRRTGRLALTMGDPAGIGPELIAKILSHQDSQVNGPYLVCAPPKVLDRALNQLGGQVAFQVVESLETLADCGAGVALFQGTIPDCEQVPAGKVTAQAGQAAYHSLLGAMQAAREGWVDGIVTAPLSKLALSQAGCDLTGHTELLARGFGVPQVAMMLYVPPSEAPPCRGLAVAHATLHTSIASVPGLLTTNRIVDCIELVQSFLKRIGLSQPTIGVSALNPHGGEGGLFGDEEDRVIRPAVEQSRSAGLTVSGPIPADALIRRAVYGEFDGVVVMYHDQGHIPLKLIAFERAVNVTLGLPIVRTSPSHGTAFDIVGRGQADPSGMLAAVQVARRLLRQSV